MYFLLFLIKTCDIRAEGGKRFLTLKNVELDQAGEVSYQALNAITSAMLTVTGEFMKKTNQKWVHNLTLCTDRVSGVSFDR